ncbi:hypothetical protein D3C84_489380 [compost metagenome]
MGEQGVFRQLQQEEVAIGLHQRLDMAHRGADILGGVNHVGGNHHIEGLSLQPLSQRVFLGVEDLCRQVRVLGAVASLGALQEQLRQVGKAVLGDVRGKRLEGCQHVLGATAGTCTDLQQANPRLRVGRQDGLDLGRDLPPDHGSVVVDHRVFLVDRLHQGHRTVGEKHIGGFLAPAQHIGNRLDRHVDKTADRGQERGFFQVILDRLPALPAVLDAVFQGTGKDQQITADSHLLLGLENPQACMEPAQQVMPLPQDLGEPTQGVTTTVA